MKVVVTGGAGFIGANLCAALASDASVTDVVAFDDLSTGCLDNLVGPGLQTVKLIEGTILDPVALDDAFSGADAVVHLAARPSVPRSLADPTASHMVNATGTVAVLDAARRAGGPLVVAASSSSVYGANPTIPKSEDLAPRPVSPYAASKLAAEAYCASYQHSFGLPTLCFRFFNVFGPLQAAGHAYAAVVPAFVEAALEERPVPVHGDGAQTRDFTFVDTVTAVLCDAVLRRVTAPDPLNLAFGSRRDLLSVIAALETILGHPVEREHLGARPGDVRDSQADSTRLRERFPDIEPTAFDVGLRRTVEWFRGLPS